VEIVTPSSETLRYRRAEDLILRLHALISRREGDGNDANDLREALFAEWKDLSPIDQHRLQRLSAELAMTYGAERARRLASSRTMRAARKRNVKRVSKVEWKKREDARKKRVWRKAGEAWYARKWEEALELFRQAPSAWNPWALAFFRSRAYHELGHIKPAMRFLRYAHEVHPQHVFRVLLMNGLAQAGEFAEALQLAKQCLDNPQAKPLEVFTAVEVLQRDAKSQSEALYHQRLLDLSERVRVAISSLNPASQVTPDDVGLGYLLLGSLFDELGQRDRAYNVLTEGISRVPNDSSLRVGRGLFATSDVDAFNDFYGAVRVGVQHEYPYAEVARITAAQLKFALTYEVANLGLTIARSWMAIAVLLTYRAIAAFELGHSNEVVEADFDAAKKLAPENEQILKNYHIFLALSMMTKGQESAQSWQSADLGPEVSKQAREELLLTRASTAWDATAEPEAAIAVA